VSAASSFGRHVASRRWCSHWDLVGDLEQAVAVVGRLVGTCRHTVETRPTATSRVE
jgi:hypothetical protein